MKRIGVTDKQQTDTDLIVKENIALKAKLEELQKELTALKEQDKETKGKKTDKE